MSTSSSIENNETNRSTIVPLKYREPCYHYCFIELPFLGTRWSLVDEVVKDKATSSLFDTMCWEFQILLDHTGEGYLLVAAVEWKLVLLFSKRIHALFEFRQLPTNNGSVASSGQFHSKYFLIVVF